MDSYLYLCQTFARLHYLEHFSALGEWDMAVNVTSSAASARAVALAELAAIRTSIITNPILKEKLLNCLKALVEQKIWERNCRKRRTQRTTEISNATSNTSTQSLAASEIQSVNDLPPAPATVFSPLHQSNLREMHRIWLRENKISFTLKDASGNPLRLQDLNQQLTIACAQAESALRMCREANSWTAFCPYFQVVIDLSRQRGKLLAEGTDMTAYEALMDEYEPNLRVKYVKKVFRQLKRWLPPLVQAVVEKQQKEEPILEAVGPFSVKEQRKLSYELMKTWGFDFEGGRLDKSLLPFCGGVPEDVRITARYTEDNYDSALMGLIHECGHAKYEQNRPRDLLTVPISNTRSIGIHESQSLFSEMHLGRSPHFCHHLLTLIRQHFGDQPAFTYSNFVRSMLIVKPGPIRLDADELCYPLHIILRFEIELALIDGKLNVSDLPQMWNKLLFELLHIRSVPFCPGGGRGGLNNLNEKDRQQGSAYTKNNNMGYNSGEEMNYSEGPLQDIHWAMGSFGYFPTYTIGAMYAAQFYHAMQVQLNEEEMGGGGGSDTQLQGVTSQSAISQYSANSNYMNSNFRDGEDGGGEVHSRDVVANALRRGNLSKMLEWQKKNIWSKGSILTTKQLLKQCTNESVLNVYFYRQHLTKRYLGLNVDEPPKKSKGSHRHSHKKNQNGENGEGFHTKQAWETDMYKDYEYYYPGMSPQETGDESSSESSCFSDSSDEGEGVKGVEKEMTGCTLPDRRRSRRKGNCCFRENYYPDLDVDAVLEHAEEGSLERKTVEVAERAIYRNNVFESVMGNNW